MTLAEALQASGLDAREARLLLAAASGLSQAGVIAHADRPLAKVAWRAFRAMCERRRNQEPIAYIVGRQEFYGVELAVSAAVLIPRPETELLVELALERPFASALDLGTGSGAIALALRTHRPAARVVAVEASAAALEVARGNAARHGAAIDFRHGCWFEPLAAERFDVIVANPPYVAEGDPHLAALAFEPAAALLGGPDGLAAIREIVAGAGAHLAPGGRLYLEHGLGQDDAVRRLMRSAGLEDVATWPDLAGIGRVTGGQARGKG